MVINIRIGIHLELRLEESEKGSEGRNIFIVYKSKYFAAKRQPLRIRKFLVITSPEQISKTINAQRWQKPFRGKISPSIN